MNLNELLPLAVIASSLLPALLIFALPEESVRLRTALNLFAAITKLALVGALLLGVHGGEEYAFRHTVLPGMDLVFKIDALALLFVTCRPCSGCSPRCMPSVISNMRRIAAASSASSACA
jgi:multicomponent Na+:H+ antiporter subunit D